MDGARQGPFFPSEGVAAKALELGFGSGPWSRSELAGRWTESVANKFINDAKAAGWLIAPFRDEFYVLPARDLAIVGWLPSFEREEFIISRMLATLGIRYWCFSAWARGRGLLFPEPLFATDMERLPDPLSFPKPMMAPPTPEQLASALASRARSWNRLPYLENLIILPAVPQTSRAGRRVDVTLPWGSPKKPAATPWAFESDFQGTAPTTEVQAIPYVLAPDLDDPAWIVALVFSLGIPRAEELVEAALEEAVKKEPSVRQRARRKGVQAADLSKRFRRWASLLAPPAPNGTWRERVAKGPPFLLVPPRLADEASSSARARRFEDQRQVQEWLDARS